jgi:zinc transporter ZupT
MKWFNPTRWLPYTHEGRQTLVYLVFAGAGPALTAVVIWAMLKSLDFKLFQTFSQLALVIAAGMFVVVVGLSMFVSIRAVKLGKDGFSAEGGGDPIRDGDTLKVEKTDG